MPAVVRAMAPPATSGQGFEIVSTLVYSHGLPPNPAMAGEPRHCLLLQYAIDRLLLAAGDFKWPGALAVLGHARAHQTLLREIEAHLRGEYADTAAGNCLFVIRLSFDRDGHLTLMSGQRPLHPPGTLVYPMLLPAPGGAASSSRRTSRRMAPLIPVYVDRGFLVPSLFTRHKTTHRAPYSEAHARVGLHSATPLTQGEVLLVNTEGEVMDGGFTTLYFWRQDDAGDWGWCTPRLESGTKVGVSRRWALEHAVVAEAAVMAKDLVDGEGVWLSSAVGGFVRGSISFNRHEGDSSGSDAAV